ncbi:MAG TPA: lamin tail domain-containing protein, partial [Clostridia bacterium]|nr:lamin tail domain-containing protein [Clostridia bacterium]
RSLAGNSIAPNTPVPFTALAYAIQDIGEPATAAQAGNITTNGVQLQASGKGIGGLSDQFGFACQLFTGDFDIQARVTGFSAAEVWAKAGLMARETLTPRSRFAAVFTTPAFHGTRFEYRNTEGGSSQAAGGFPANYPNTWVRLKRAGNLFTGYASYDAKNWTQLGSANMNLAAQLYLGFAVSSQDEDGNATAQFADQGTVTSPALAAVINPSEPLGPSSRKTPIAISEIMYKPAPTAGGGNLEFIELFNSNPWSHDLSGYRLVAEEMSYTFPQGTILGGGNFLVVSPAPEQLAAASGLTYVGGPYQGTLKKSGTLKLLDERGAELLIVPYSDEPPWPAAADGAGHSLVLAGPTYGEGDPRAWAISDIIGGSPGRMEAFRPSPLRNVVINEMLAHTDPPEWDFVELYNHSNEPVDVSGCVLTDDPATNKFLIPNDTVIPARGFLSFNELSLGFALSAQGETIYFLSADLTRCLDAVRFGGQENAVSSGRVPDGARDFYRLASTTPGTNNAPIRLEKIVFNEIMYHPVPADDALQYVELHNRSGETVMLEGWRLAGGISFEFPPGSALPAGGYLVIARNAAALRAKHPHLNAVNCLGDFSGRLSHKGERLLLTMPDTVVSTNTLGQVLSNRIDIAINELHYNTGGQWGDWSDGGGSSLELIDPAANNRLGPNWADSDETQKSHWTTIETTGVLDHGNNFTDEILYAQIGLLDVGECLVDNIEILAGTGGANLVANPGFESGLANWSLQGSHARSSLAGSGY